MAIALAFMALWFTRSTTLPMIGAWLDVGEEPSDCDYVMILNGDKTTRPFEAAKMLLNGRADRALITSVKKAGRDTAEPETYDIVRAVLIRCGIPNSKITFVDSQCTSTFDEAKTLDAFMAKQADPVRVAVVTNEYHTRRTRWVFREVIGERISNVHFVSARTDYFNSSNWWKHEDGFVWYLSEFFKFTYYQYRYGRALWWTLGLIGTSALALGISRSRRKQEPCST